MNINTYPQPSEEESASSFITGKETTGLSARDRQSIVLLSWISGIVAALYAAVMALIIYLYTDNLIVSVISLLFVAILLIFFHRIVFNFSGYGNRGKWLIMTGYIIIYLLFSVLTAWILSYFSLESEIGKFLTTGHHTSLDKLTAYLQVTDTLTEFKNKSLMNFRTIVFSISVCISMLPLLANSLIHKNVHNTVSVDKEQQRFELQQKINAKKAEYIHLIESYSTAAAAADPFAPDPAGTSQTEKRKKLIELTDEINLLEEALKTLF